MLETKRDARKLAPTTAVHESQMRTSKAAVEVKPHIDKHAVLPVFFNEPPDLTGWCEGVPGAGRVIAVKSVLYSDGSAKRWYRVKAVKATKKPSKREKRVSKKKWQTATTISVNFDTHQSFSFGRKKMDKLSICSATQRHILLLP
jgi:hypothetical protein